MSDTAYVAIDAKCTECGANFDRASSPTDNEKPRPEAGDISMCMTCGHFMEFDDDCKLQDMSETKMNLVMSDPRLTKVLATYRAVNKKAVH